MKNSKSKTKPARPSRGKNEKPSELNQATTAEFQREGMGVAPKE
jgi:hypothetical protein